MLMAQSEWDNMFYFKNWLVTESSNKYSCVLARLPKEIAKKVITWGHQHIADNELTTDGREDDPHITVLYGLHTKKRSRCC